MYRPASTFDLAGFLRDRLALSQLPTNENPPDQEKTPLANGQTPSYHGDNGPGTGFLTVITGTPARLVTLRGFWRAVVGKELEGHSTLGVWSSMTPRRGVLATMNSLARTMPEL